MAETPPTLHAVAPFVTRSVQDADRGVVVLAIDGLPFAPAAEAFTSAAVGAARSTFPSTSVTAWLTSVTGVDVAEHHAAGMAMRVPGSDRVAMMTSSEAHGWDDTAAVPADLVGAPPTIFDTARAQGAGALVWAPELEALHGPWIRALTHGADWIRSRHDLSTDPQTVVRHVIAAVDGVLDGVRGPTLLWAYTNLDDHLHVHGPDAAIAEALRELDSAARRWAERGWSVIAHADHGQTRVRTRPDLHEAWDRLATPKYCRAPAGGAGRVRWLYPYADQAGQVRDDLRDALGDQADVLTFDALAKRGLLPDTEPLRERIGEIVALAAGPGFPVHRASDHYDHGCTTDDETAVAFAVWPPGPTL
jgi:hypothetical protein